jgi:hypothetical protein
MASPPPLPPPPTLPPGRPLPENRPFDLVRCLTFIKDDPEWMPKLLWGSLAVILGAVLVGIPLLWGYNLRVVRRAAAGLEPPLPEWDDWGGIFMDGLKAAVVLIAHYIGVGVLLLPLALVLFVVPGSMDDPSGLFAVALFGMVAIAFVVFLVFAVYVHAALVRLAILGELKDAFQPAAVIDFLRRNLGNTALAWVAFIVANFVAKFGFLLCCVGLLPATFWSTTVMFYSLGEVARLDPELGEAARRSVG